MLKTAFFAIAFCAAVPRIAVADDKLYSVAPDKSFVKYTLVHKAHTFVGTADKGIEGKVKLSGTTAQLMVRIPVANFDSGNNNRDSNMRDTVEATKFPNVELKAVAEGVTPQDGQKTKHTLKGKLTFHGVTNNVEVPVDVTWNGKSAKVTGKFSISLEAYKIDRPSLLFVKVEDKLDLDVDLTITE
ncbi:MAG: YceI family protein [Deltaproteobacteria bacterium]|nr:YceI family protein [Deltaproteobacteria bacterium]